MENKYMKIAINEALHAIKEGEMPVGAVIVQNEKVIASAHNIRNTQHDPTLHAEIVAMREACKIKKDWRLDDCDLYVTLEPCAMCSGAIINSRLRNVYYGAYDPEYGAAGGRIDLFSKSYFGSTTKVFGGIMEDECTKLLKEFFASLRKK